MLNMAHPNAQNLVGCYPFLESAGLLSRDAVKNRSVYLKGITQSSLSGWSDNGILFNGTTDFVTARVPTIPEHNFGTSPFSIFSQFKTTSAGSTLTLCGKWNSGGAAGVGRINYRLVMKDAVGANVAGRVAFVVYESGSGLNRSVTTTRALNDGKIHTILCGINRAGLMYMYVDGVFDLTGNTVTVGTNITNTGSFAIGALDASTDVGFWFFNGTIYHTRLYNKAPSATLAAALHANPYADFMVSPSRYYLTPLGVTNIKRVNNINYTSLKNVAGVPIANIKKIINIT